MSKGKESQLYRLLSSALSTENRFCTIFHWFKQYKIYQELTLDIESESIHTPEVRSTAS